MVESLLIIVFNWVVQMYQCTDKRTGVPLYVYLWHIYGDFKGLQDL